MGNLRYVWQHRWGRLAVLLIVVGTLGLITHYWAPVVLLGALPAEVRHLS